MGETGERQGVFFSYGFRPFFLAAALWAIMDILIWMSLFEHGGGLPSRFDPLSWHIHEMLFGFIMAAVAGFLLTAVANWTGRPPLRGGLLALLAASWLWGRVACTISALLPAWFVILSDLALPLLLLPLVAREIIAARNWRNLVMLVPVTVLGVANLLMHLEALGVGVPVGLGWRLGIVAVLILVSAVGGRIVPAFTRNWLVKKGESGLPAIALLNRVAMASLHTGLLLWAFLPESRVSGTVLLLSAVLNAWRLARWSGIKTASEPLLLVLHLGHVWLVVGLVLLGLSALGAGVPQTAALHSMTVGAIATMILAVMTRATRGHTGRPLTADRPTILIYLLVTGAAITRVLAGFGVWQNPLLVLSAALWAAAFLLFAAVYGGMLLQSRVQT